MLPTAIDEEAGGGFFALFKTGQLMKGPGYQANHERLADVKHQPIPAVTGFGPVADLEASRR